MVRIRILKDKLKENEADVADPVANALVEAGYAERVTDPATENPNGPEAQAKQQPGTVGARERRQP